jgi:hypothetical protein
MTREVLVRSYDKKEKRNKSNPQTKALKFDAFRRNIDI